MRRAIILLGIVASACSAEPVPLGGGPTPLPNTGSRSNAANSTGSVWAMAIEPTGQCILGATAEVIAGQKSGATLVQQPCDVWSLDGGFFWRDLAPQESMTIRVSAQGYISTERTLRPQVGGGRAEFFELTKSN